MALSASVDFAITRDTLVEYALKHIGALGDGESPSATQLSEGGTLLNILIKTWFSDEFPLWARYYGYVLPISNVSSINIGAEGTGHVPSSYVFTTTSAASSSGATTLTVTSITGMSASDNIGIELDDGTMQWTTISGAPSGSTVTLAVALTDDVASGAAIYTYANANKIKTPSKIIEAFRRQSSTTDSSVVDVSMIMLSANEYNLLGSKGIEGPPIQWFYDGALNLSTTGYPGNRPFYFWPRFENGDYVIVIHYLKPYDDLDAATNNPEFPQEYFLPLMMGLAWLEAPKHGLPLKERQLLLQEAMMMKDLAQDKNQEEGSIFLQRDERMH